MCPLFSENVRYIKLKLRWNYNYNLYKQFRRKNFTRYTFISLITKLIFKCTLSILKNNFSQIASYYKCLHISLFLAILQFKLTPKELYLKECSSLKNNLLFRLVWAIIYHLRIDKRKKYIRFGNVLTKLWTSIY